MAKNKQISEDKFHYAMALYMIARRRQAEVESLSEEINEILGIGEGNYLEDQIYDMSNKGNVSEFKKAMRIMHIEMEQNDEKKV